MPTKKASATNEYAVQKIAESIHEGVDRVTDAAAGAERRLRKAAEDAERGVRSSGEKARKRSEEVANEAAAFVEEHPVASLGIAFVVGMMLSNMLRR